MAFFKFRKGGDEQPAAPAQPESVEVLRRRAKNRLIGAAILVLIGVIGFPLLVDKQPRPVAVDLPIEIPERDKVLPLAAPEAPQPAAEAASAPLAAPLPSVPAAASPAAAAPAAEKAVAEKSADKSADKAADVPAAKAPAKPAPVAKPESRTESKPEPKPGKGDAKAEPKAAQEGRYVVQVGSFADEGRAREVRGKLERAGLKNYTQAVETKDGRRIRVRAGPFASKAEADRVAEKLRKLDLPAAVLSL